MKKLPESFFQIENYTIEEAVFKIKPLTEEKIVYTPEFDYELGNIEKHDDKLYARLFLTLAIKGRGKRRKILRDIKVRITGVFSAQGSAIDEVTFERFCKVNGLANLILICRSFIATTTGQMGMPPVIIPLANLLKTSVAPSKRSNSNNGEI